MPRLIVITKDIPASVHDLGGSWATIGRGDGNTFQLVESSISGRHCEVRVQGAELIVRDLLSTNGTFVGEQRISEAKIKAGEVFRLGDVELRFELGDTPVTASASTGKAVSGQPGVKTQPMAALGTAHKTPSPAPSPGPTPAPVEANEPEKQFQVLFVDDSMAFLELFGGLCSEYSGHTWKIHKATSADAALALLRQVVVDLVLLDITMPMLDGLQLLNIINRRYPGLKIAVMTGSATEGKRADALANGAELFLEKPVTADGMRSVFNMLDDLLSWDREGFTGGLRQVNLQEVIQVECNGRHSSILEIRNPEMRGQIYIEAGAITHAAAGELTGEQAFRRLLSLRGGAFHVLPFRRPPQRTINTSWEFLLMDAARANDEQKVAAQKGGLPDPAQEDVIHRAVGDDVMVFPAGEAKPKSQPGSNPGK